MHEKIFIIYTLVSLIIIKLRIYCIITYYNYKIYLTYY